MKVSSPASNPAPEDLDALAEHYRQELLRTYRRRAPAPTPPKAAASVPPPVQEAIPAAAVPPADRLPRYPLEPTRTVPTPPLPSDDTPSDRRPRYPLERPLGRSVPTVADALPAPELTTEEAYLQIIVTTAENALPVAGATVIVTTADDHPQLLRLLTTDASGRTPVISLPAVRAAYSLEPGTAVPYTTYNVEVSSPGFYRVEEWRLPLFGGVTSLQPVQLIPLPQTPVNDGFIVQEQIPSYDL